MPRKLITLFFSAFLLNLIWEHLHSVLYVSYQSGAITNAILLQAALFDAAVITIFSFPFLLRSDLHNPFLLRSNLNNQKKTRWILYVALVIFAVILEKWALVTGRWVYSDVMPIIPYLQIGLTPVIQLGVLAYMSLWLSDFLSKREV
ncbi:MAG: hypothetical protein Q7R93_02895 [bacterium]|nr:hypothetical protein [bacterium]